MIPEIRVKTLQSLHHRAMLYGMKYGLGAKIPLSTPEARLKGKRVDCSGWVRYLIYQSTDNFIIPDGSYYQRDFFHLRASLVSYNEVGEDMNNLFIAFISPTPAHKIGHVWLARAGWTYESHGGVGPNSRHWDTNILKSEVSACYRLPHVWE